ncbi:Protein of unknown function [Variovorax sp. HW608]|uniref:GIN domain-containing protein n=1 Tax=Variovorax sp. HW608 TaxID=1034889 RepID=UPI00081F7665|nr:DUF2807 domain-containing protein [Variovorax sp. HW608]SCK52782.1 Protein of unknown function [Variovorax sp. HW608]
MNKEEFLRKIRAALQGLTPAEIDEILADYGAHFDESTALGRSEEATAAALGDPAWLGQEHVADLRQEEHGLLSAAKRLLDPGRRSHGDNTVVERQIAWTPGSRMTIGLPVDVSWRPADHPRATLHGPAWLVEHVRLESEQFKGRFKWRLFHNNHLRLDLESPAIETWHVKSHGDLRLLHLSQAALNLELDGSGDIKAAGRVQELSAHLLGSGDIDLSLLEPERATVTLAGSGDVTLAPGEEADLSIEGSGDIVLLSHPARLRSHVWGSGKIRMPDGTGSPS